jgi:hypothetical protein
MFAKTQSLFRLTPAADNDLTRPIRQVAIVAADAENEARHGRCTMSSNAIGGIRISPSATRWKRPSVFGLISAQSLW